MKHRFLNLQKLAYAITLIFAVSNTAAAKQSGDQDLKNERQRLFQTILAQPSNITASLEYAALSVKLGDLEGAVSTLERILIFSPGHSRVQLELGVLYYRLGNFDTAKAYFQDARQGRGATKQIEKLAEKYIEAIEKRLKRLRWSGSSFLGLRWNSNINAAPASRNMVFNGVPVTLGPRAIKKRGFGLVNTNRAHIEYDLHAQGDRIEIDYVDFSSINFSNSRFNTTIAEVTIGPSFNMGRFGIDDTFASIYGIGNGALLGPQIYFGTLGVGSRFVSKLDTDLRLIVKAEYRRQWFRQTVRRPSAKTLDGREYRGLAELKYSFDPNVLFTLGGRLSRKDVRARFYDHWEYGALAKFDFRFDGPVQLYDRPWKLSVFGGYLHRNYDRAHPVINAALRQRDNELYVAGSLDMPFARYWSIVPKLEYRQVRSNYALRSYKALSAMIGVSFRQ